MPASHAGWVALPGVTDRKAWAARAPGSDCLPKQALRVASNTIFAVGSVGRVLLSLGVCVPAARIGYEGCATDYPTCIPRSCWRAPCVNLASRTAGTRSTLKLGSPSPFLSPAYCVASQFCGSYTPATIRSPRSQATRKTSISYPKVRRPNTGFDELVRSSTVWRASHSDLTHRLHHSSEQARHRCLRASAPFFSECTIQPSSGYDYGYTTGQGDRSNEGR
ncbi:hypothetical protein LMG24235_08355 [Paraburkholderia sabiae]|nr:hypothetical protein LMG24235_08355 [Paraburkholderia sabiae]